jgi:iron complex outermembrane receptor protein
MSKKPYNLRRSLLAASVSTALSTLALAAIATGAYAQEEDSLEEVVVTGSRILRRDFESNSPIVTVDQGDFEQQAGMNIESYLNQLPTYNPAASPVTTQGDVQITPVNSVGIASISLRGFGPNRSLVLVNGKRPTPINALMVTDVNGVPSALIERVETITGGASAVYGADAVGGVTNFILRDNFEGFEIDTQYGITEAGDGEETRISAVLGANFADGNGNVTMGLERYARKEALQVERDIYTDYWSSTDTPGSFFFLQGVNNYGCNFNCAPQATMNALYGGQNPRNPNIPNTLFAAYNFNPDGTVWVAGSALGQSRSKIPVDGLQYALTKALDSTDPTGNTIYDAAKWNNIEAFASAPQERYSFFATGTFDFNDKLSAYARVNFAESKTETLLFGTNAISGWEASVPYNPTTDSPVDPTLNYKDGAIAAAVLGNPAGFPNPNFIPTGAAGAHFPVPAQLAVLLNARPNPSGIWQPNWNPERSLEPRSTYNTNSVWQVEFGLEFELPVRDWTGEAYVSHGQSATYNEAHGNMSLTRYRTLINQPDYGRNASGTGNQNYFVNGQEIPAVRPRFGVGDFTCQSGFYDTLFAGDAPLSKDCFDAINANLQTRTENTQEIIELNFQGSVIDLPAGESRFAAGYQKRINKARFNPDILQSQDSFTDQVIGVYPTGYLDASTSVDDYYVEALVPVLANLPGIQMLELELGARYSDYRETEAQTTWKALANWQINDWARIRGGFNRATRAPNIGELFLNPQEVFTGGGNFGDACSVRSNAPFGAGGTGPDNVLNPNEPPVALASGQTQAGATSARLICEELMGGAGSIAANQYYNVADSTVQGGGGGFAWVLQEGNSTLQSETADTWTLGAVIRSPWENEWLSGLNFTLDYYNVEITDAIMLQSIDQAVFSCYGAVQVSTAAEAKAQAQSAACQLVPRDSNNGAALNTSISYGNQATIKTAGFDVGVNWIGELEELVGLPGRLGLSMNATVLDTYETKQSAAAFDVLTEWKGSLGPNLSGTNGGAYDYRLFGSMTYFKDDWSVSLRWRHLPEVWSANYAAQAGVIANNARVSAGDAGIILGYTPNTEIQTDSYNIFDLAANWNVNETFTLRAGITNLFDEEPTNSGSSAGRPPGTDLSAASQCGGAPGCRAAGGYSLPSRGGFNGGYYDTLGRRMFIGVKANF